MLAPLTSGQLLAAIESGSLDCRLISNGEVHTIGILIDREPVAAVGCLHIERPSAKVGDDERSVDVFPSPGMPDGFSIACGTHEEACLIAESLEECFETAYLDLVDPMR